MIYLAAAVIFVLGNLFAVALCRAAARGDRMGAIAKREDVVESYRSTIEEGT